MSLFDLTNKNKKQNVPKKPSNYQARKNPNPIIYLLNMEETPKFGARYWHLEWICSIRFDNLWDNVIEYHLTLRIKYILNSSISHNMYKVFRSSRWILRHMGGNVLSIKKISWQLTIQDYQRGALNKTLMSLHCWAILKIMKVWQLQVVIFFEYMVGRVNYLTAKKIFKKIRETGSILLELMIWV